MPVYSPNSDDEGRVVQVRGMDGSLLMTLNTETMTVDVRRHGKTHRMKLHDLIAFSRTSQRIVFHTETVYDSDDIVTQRFE